MKYFVCAAAMIAAPLAPAVAADITAGASFEHTNFSGDFGKRQVGELSLASRWDDTTLVFVIAHGRRDYADEDYSASRFKGTLYHDWTDRFYTRTSVAAASTSPVFPTHDITQELNYKIARNSVATGGVRHIRYFGGRDAIALSAGGSYYFKGGFANYRYSSYDVDDLGHSHGHVGSVRINDRSGRGQSQIWVGAGTALHEYEVLPALSKGEVRSVSLRRLQPLNDKVALDLNIARNWYDTGVADYRGTTFRLGFTMLR